jgi:hypothetical protein
MSTRTDAYHGRQGGHWPPDDYDGMPLDNAKPCVECGQPILAAGRDRHHACDPRSIVGRRCSCTPGCTETHVGDQGPCKPDCEVCTLLAGRLYAEVDGWRKRKSDGQADEETHDQPEPTLWGVSA